MNYTITDHVKGKIIDGMYFNLKQTISDLMWECQKAGVIPSWAISKVGLQLRGTPNSIDPPMSEFVKTHELSYDRPCTKYDYS